MFPILLRYYLLNFRRFFERNRAAKVFVVSGFLVTLGFLIVLVYLSFYYGFQHIARDAYFKEVLILYVIELFYLVSFLLVYASAMMSGVFTLFRSGRDEFIMASPHFSLKLSLALLRMFLSSLWPLLVIIIPALVALRVVFGLSGAGFVISLLSSVVTIGVANAFAIVTLLLIATLLDILNIFSLRRVIFTAVAVFAGLFALIWERFRSVDLVTFFQARLLDATQPNLAPILDQFRIFPSHLSVLSIHFSQLKDYHDALFALVYSTLLCIVVMTSFFFLRKGYLEFWQKGQEGKRAVRSGASYSLRFARALIARAETPEAAIVRKEIVAFLRNSKGMLWVGFIVFIWIIQSASSRFLAHGLATDRVANADMPNVVGVLQFAIILYFVALFVLRFAFPSFSSEHKTGWIALSAPIDLNQVFFAKLSFFTVLFSIIAVAFTLWNTWSLGLLLPFGAPLMFIVLLSTFFLTVYGLSLGALFPNTETDDPERLSTTLPGIGFILGALFYGALGAYALQKFFLNDDMLLFSLFILSSLIAALVLVSRVHIAFTKVRPS